MINVYKVLIIFTKSTNNLLNLYFYLCYILTYAPDYIMIVNILTKLILIKGVSMLMNIFVCVGSSCHIKGSYEIINLMKDAIASNHLEDKVNLSASFCLGNCTDGVTIKINEEIICGISKVNFDNIFQYYVLNRLNN